MSGIANGGPAENRTRANQKTIRMSLRERFRRLADVQELEKTLETYAMDFASAAIFVAISSNGCYASVWRGAVPVIIDGNNLIHAARAVHPSGVLLGRRMLCDAVGKWAELRRERVHIIFDGPFPPGDFAKQLAHPALLLTFSGAFSADQVLIEHLETDSAARRLVVVSSDREIARAARRRRATPLRSDHFWALLTQDLQRPPPPPGDPPEKRHGLRPEDTEAWLRLFGLDPPET